MAGNTTNPYLTKKAQEKRRLSIPVVAVCTIFGLGAASAGIDLFREGKTLSGVMAVLLLAALFTPVVRTFAHYRRSFKPRFPPSKRPKSSGRSSAAATCKTCKSTRMSGR